MPRRRLHCGQSSVQRRQLCIRGKEAKEPMAPNELAGCALLPTSDQARQGSMFCLGISPQQERKAFESASTRALMLSLRLEIT